MPPEDIDLSHSERASLLSRLISRRQALLGVAGVAAGLGMADLLEACGNNSNTTSTVHTDTINIGITPPDGPTTSDPTLLQNFASGYPLLWSCAEQLYRRDINGKVQPALATDWQVAADKLTWTFTMRSGVKMQDGSTFTARDAETAVNRILKLPKYNLTSFAAFVKNIASVKVLDDMHLQVVTKTPYPTLLIDMPAPIPTDYYNKIGDDKFSAQPLAAGPFKFVSLAPNQSYVYVRFDDYWDKTRFPNFKNLNYKIVADESTRVAGVQSGDLDAIQGIGAQSAQQLQASKNVRVIRNDNVAIGEIFLPSLATEPGSPLKDQRVRQALLYAIDRQSLARTLFAGQATVLPVAIPSVALGYDTKLKPYPYDPNTAKRLLAESGVSNLAITLTAQAPDALFPNIQNVAQAISQNWAAVGVKTDLNPMEPATMQQVRRAGKLRGGLLIAGLANSYFELAYIAPVSYASTSPNHNMADPALDEIISRLVVATDTSERARIGTEFVDYLHSSVPVIPLLGLPAYYAIGPKVKSLKPQAATPPINPWFLTAA